MQGAAGCPLPKLAMDSHAHVVDGLSMRVSFAAHSSLLEHA